MEAVVSVQQKGLLFDIQGFSVDDGPGCRTLVFLKGCPLRCRWCCNPEGVSPRREVMYDSSKCARDYACVDACPNSALSIGRGGDSIAIDRTKCSECEGLECVRACQYGGLRVVGFHLTPDELVARIEKDREYWGSGGGVTLSGGEPLLQAEFATEVLRKCHESYVHTAVETCGQVPWRCYEGALAYIDWLFFDIKHMDSELHKEATGVSNELILENAKRIASESGCRMVPRVTVIPGFNDSPENITATAEFVRTIGLGEVNVLPIHHLGSSKYELLGLRYEYAGARAAQPQRIEEIREIFASRSVRCYLGSSTPF